MRCSSCRSENPAGKKFCGDCGAPLENRCPKCSAENPPGKRFCADCGALLDPPAEAAPPDGGPTGERRHLTVLFCDLVGSTEIAAQLDPEEWRETVASYHRAAAAAITRYGGHVAKFLGDGVMALFGYPEAHDNDAERAARAALAILEAISKLNDLPTRPKLDARIGIDSGAVVVGIGAGRDADVFGETPNIAARVQAVAAPGIVLITAATHRLISGLFVVEALAPHELKGVPTPVQLFQVIRPTGVHGRLAAARGLTPFVGREEELRLLLSRWQRAREGEGQLALVVGEGGIGKSRLVAEFRECIRDNPHIWMESAGEHTKVWSSNLRPVAGTQPANFVSLELREVVPARGSAKSPAPEMLRRPTKIDQIRASCVRPDAFFLHQLHGAFRVVGGSGACEMSLTERLRQ